MNPPPFKKRIVMAAGRISMVTVFRLSKLLSLRGTAILGNILGDLMYVASKRYRGVAVRSLTAAFPSWTSKEVRKVARQTFRNFARGTLEFFYIPTVAPEVWDDLMEFKGTAYIDAALEQGHGLVMITAHMGNWELFARRLVRMGYKVNVIARDSDDPTMTGVTNTIRQQAGYKVLSRDNAALPSIRCLKRNEILGILPDQNTLSGIFVDFFGRPVATATGPAVFAMKAEAPVICAFTRRLPNGKFEAVVRPPLKLPITGDEEADIRHITEAFTSVIEDAIRENPSQWLWLHDRWKRTNEAPSETSKRELVH